jgi:hypothetical protein
MEWFGETWGAPINQMCERTTTPVQEECIFCNHPIQAGDRGFVMPYLKDDMTTEAVASHLRCFIRSIGVRDPNE